MKTKRSPKPAEQGFDDGVLRSPDRRRGRTGAKTGEKAQAKTQVRAAKPKNPRRPADPAARTRTRNAKSVKNTRGRAPGREQRGLGTPPGHAPATTPVRTPAPAKNASQAKARAKARKAKAPKVVRVPLRERLITRLESIDLRPRALAARVPFVVLVIGALGVGLGVTLWLSTDAAERSYQLGAAQQTNQALLQQKEALERDVLEAQAPPALAEAARGLGMIPSRDTAHLVQDPAGNWMVVGSPKPAEGAPPPPLNTPLPDVTATPRPRPAAPAAQDPAAALERPVRITPPARVPAPAVLPAPEHAPGGLPAEPLAAVPGSLPAPLTGPLPGPVEAVPDPAIVPPADAAPEPAPAPAPEPIVPPPGAPA
ncbi:MAG: hypothetical protein ABW042_04775 [Phenylobacterium sp.]